MTQTIESEPTLTDVINKIDGLTNEIDGLAKDVERSNEKFDNYQKAVQWVVQLAFSLIASATVTIIITSVLKN